MLRRNTRVTLTPLADGYSVMNRDGLKKLNSNDNYFIYMKNVNLKGDGSIDGRYLGVASDNLIDNQCKDAVYGDEGYTVDDNRIRTARMVAVKNGTESRVIIIQ